MVSIIIPIFNPGKKLSKCLQSIKEQSYQKIEVIMINDGSTDNSAIVCKKYAETDSRFIYIEQENSGVSSARNKGILHSRGEYICFVDSDDSVESDYIECMRERIKTTHADIVIQGLTNIFENKNRENKQFPDIFLKTSELNDKMFEEMFYFCGPYCKLFHSNYIKDYNIEFPTDLSYGEDFVFYARYLYYCNNIAFISHTSYNYSVAVSGSLSSKQLHPDLFWKNQVNRRKEYKVLRKKYGIEKEFYPTENSIKLIAIRGLLSSIKYYKLNFKEYIDKVKNNEDFGLKEIHVDKLSDRLIISLFNINNSLSRKILKFIIR